MRVHLLPLLTNCQAFDRCCSYQAEPGHSFRAASSGCFLVGYM
jgi:hypothetical protein